MSRLWRWLTVRHRQSWGQLVRFGLVGGTGVVVNLAVVIACRRLGPHPEALAIDLPLTDFNVRAYHLFAMAAFVVANLWNFQLNRWWTFRSARHSAWWREYLPFVVVGLGAQVVGLGVLTLLMHPHSPLELPTSVLDDTTGFRTKVYWAQLISVLVVTPVSFALNKVWTFRRVRGLAPAGR